MNILQSIFTDYYEHIEYQLHPRPAVMENVDKMIHCGDPSFGGAMYGCSHCGNLKFVPFRCKSRFCPSFSKVKNDIYKNHSEGFYVRAKPNLCTPDVTIKYISRYLGRPVIATSRIDKYDGENVTFHYTRHEDNKTIEECVPAMDFIKRLIVHIPEKHFKMLRYYGIYAKHHKQEKKLRRCISPEKKAFFKRTLDWRNSILLTFGYDPLQCDKCGTSLSVLEVYHKKTALFERYRKVMGFG